VPEKIAAVGKGLNNGAVPPIIAFMRNPESSDTRSSLLGRLKNFDDDASWRAFHSTYAKLLRTQALHAGLDATEADDVVQETFIEISGRMQNFQYDRSAGSFKAWLLQLARWRIISQLRKRRHPTLSIEGMASNGEDISDLPGCAVEFDASWEQSWEQAVFEMAMSALKRKWAPKQFQAIDLLMVKHWSVQRVCSQLGINPTHLYVLKLRAIRQLKKEVVRFSKDGLASN
jgi:RNA polymerase sigma factor (sigma-70 family)